MLHTFQISPRREGLAAGNALASAGLDGGDDDGGGDDVDEEEGDDAEGAGGHGGQDAQELRALEASLKGSGNISGPRRYYDSDAAFRALRNHLCAVIG